MEILNLMSNLSNGVFPFGILEWVWLWVSVVDVEDKDPDEDDEDEDGGDGGGFPPLPFELFSSSFLLGSYNNRVHKFWIDFDSIVNMYIPFFLQVVFLYFENNKKMKIG